MIGATRRMLTGQKLARLESRDSEDSSGQLVLLLGTPTILHPVMIP
jgi:hypothetical protein